MFDLGLNDRSGIEGRFLCHNLGEIDKYDRTLDYANYS